MAVGATAGLRDMLLSYRSLRTLVAGRLVRLEPRHEAPVVQPLADHRALPGISVQPSHRQSRVIGEREARRIEPLIPPARLWLIPGVGWPAPDLPERTVEFLATSAPSALGQILAGK